MKLFKWLLLPIFALSLAGCVMVSAENVGDYSCGLVPEIEVLEGSRHENELSIHNISGERIKSVKLVYVEAAFDEREKNTEPNWDRYRNKLNSSIANDESAYCDLDPTENLKTLWVKVDSASNRHCVFAVVYEAGCSINVNIRKSDT